jgi:regulator of protease activity HflC (stomatin/prohibitin superfamily)
MPSSITSPDTSNRNSPFISRMTKVDLRIVTLTVPPQEVITRDNVTVKVTAVIYFYVVDRLRRLSMW